MSNTHISLDSHNMRIYHVCQYESCSCLWERYMITVVPLLTLIAALGSGLMAGLFFAFSSFIMAALAKLPAEQGIAAMNSINVTILNATFGLVFFGTTLLCLGLAVTS